jgi:hypothetical protein
MEGFDEQKVYEENWKRLNTLIELRTKQIKDATGNLWWGELIGDELYCFLISELVKLKETRMKPTTRINISEEDIKKLASGFVTVEDYMWKMFDPIEGAVKSK